ncbi:MAG: AAA family ATPase [Candidatus Thermoplasmatota archaeon]
MKRTNPFIKGYPAPPEAIIGREDHIKLFNSYLSSTINGNPLSMCIYGARGIGKTTLLRKFEEIVKQTQGVHVRVEVEDYDDVESFCKKLLTCLRDELATVSLKLKLQKLLTKIWDLLSETEITYKELGVKIPRKLTEKEAFELFFRKKLEECWRAVEKNITSIVFMIDEAEYLEKIKALRLLRNTFSRLAEQRMRYMVVLSGKLTFPFQMSKEFSPLSRFFHPERVSLMSEEEIKKLYSSAFAQVDIKIDENCLDHIVNDAAGHPYVAATVGWELYDALPENVKNISVEHYRQCKERIFNTLSAELFEVMYEKIPKAERTVLHALCESETECVSVSELANKVGRASKSISPLLRRLEGRGCIEKVAAGKFKAFHKLFREYIKKAAVRERLLIPKEISPVEEHKKPMEKLNFCLSLLEEVEIRDIDARKSVWEDFRHSLHYFFLKRSVESSAVPSLIKVIDLMEKEAMINYRKMFYDYFHLLAHIKTKEIRDRLNKLAPTLQEELDKGAPDLERSELEDLICSLQELHDNDASYIQSLIDQAINKGWPEKILTSLQDNLHIEAIERDRLRKIYVTLLQEYSKTKETKNMAKASKIKMFLDKIKGYVF